MRVVAAAALAAVVALAVGPAAVAADRSNADIAFTWGVPTFAYDGGRPGLLDVGDQVIYPYTVQSFGTAVPQSVFLWDFVPSAKEFSISGAAGARTTGFVGLTVTADMAYGPDAQYGPIFSGAHIEYSVPGDAIPKALTINRPPLVSAPLHITASDLVRNLTESGTVDGKAREGDTLHFAVTVRNESIVPMRCEPAYGIDLDPDANVPFPVEVLPGAYLTVHTPQRIVTLTDMQRGAVYGDYIEIRCTFLDGSSPANYRFMTPDTATEAIAPSVSVTDPALALRIGLAPGTVRPWFDARVGDYIAMERPIVTNTGNVTLRFRTQTNYVDGAWTSSSTGAVTVAPGATVDVTPASLHPLTADEIARGYLDYTTVSEWWIDASGAGDPDATATGETRVFLRDFTPDLTMDPIVELIDSNGDGIGQEGEQVSVTPSLANGVDSEQSVEVSAFSASASSDVAWTGADPTGSVLAPGESSAPSELYTLTAGDVLRGTFTAAFEAKAVGAIDGVEYPVSGSGSVPTGEFVASPSTLDVDLTYVDANGDGYPSIGETTTVTVTVENTGSYPLTGMVMSDGVSSNVTGSMPSFGPTLGAAGIEQHSFDHVITAADFARGSLAVEAVLDATGLTVPLVSSDVLPAITFAADPADLEGVAAGGIVVCDTDGAPVTTLRPGDAVTVLPEACDFVGAGVGYRSVMFSTPIVIGLHTFAATIPADAEAGAHRIALYAPDGTLVGWQDVTVVVPVVTDTTTVPGASDGAGQMPSTGFDSWWIVAVAGALVTLGAGGIVLGRRR